MDSFEISKHQQDYRQAVASRQRVIDLLNVCLEDFGRAGWADQGNNLYIKVTRGSKSAYFIILFPDQTGLYMKLPKKHISDHIKYLRELERENYHFLLVRGCQFAMPVPMSTVIEHWQPYMAESDTNENRLQFHGKKVDTLYYTLDEVPLFEDKSVLEVIKGLLR